MNFTEYRNIIGRLLLVMIASFAQAQTSRLERLGKECLLLNKMISDPEHVKLEIAGSMLNEGDPEAALKILNTVSQDSTMERQVAILKAKGFLLKGSFRQALTELNSVSMKDDRAGHSMDEELYKVICYTHLQSYDSSRYILKNALLSTMADTSGVDEMYKKHVPRKMYDINRTMVRSALFPGVGFFSVHEPGKAFGNMALTMSFAGYAAYSVKTGYYATAALTGLFNFFRFYNGGIRGAVRVAGEKNLRNYLQSCLVLDEYARRKLKR